MLQNLTLEAEDMSEIAKEAMVLPKTKVVIANGPVVVLSEADDSKEEIANEAEDSEQAVADSEEAAEAVHLGLVSPKD